jgi:hypothetical protein
LSGTAIGGVNAAKTNKERYGTDFYKRIGSLGGAKSKTGGFGSSLVGVDGLTGRERAKIAGRTGGKVSKRVAK